MKAQGFILVLASVALGAMSVAGCSSDTNGTDGTGGGGGSLTTNPTTSSTASSTGAGGNGGSTTSASTISGSSSSTGGGTAIVGIACGGDNDCGGDLKCNTANMDDPIFGGAYQDGYCTKDCAADTDCPGDSTCLAATSATDSPKECVATCTAGDTTAPKCNGRTDLACAARQTGDPICFPICSVDGCSGNRVCDLESGTCVEDGQQHTGDAAGKTCDPAATTNTCEASCVNLGLTGAQTGLCAQSCILGNDPADNCGGPTNGLCAFSSQNAGNGDLAFCTNACSAHDDCAAPDLWCGDVRKLGWPQGFCFSIEKEDGTLPTCVTDADCPPAVIGGTSYQLDKCLETSSGKLCVGDFPLGSRAPGTGAGGAGGAGGSTP